MKSAIIKGGVKVLKLKLKNEDINLRKIYSKSDGRGNLILPKKFIGKWIYIIIGKTIKKDEEITEIETYYVFHDFMLAMTKNQASKSLSNDYKNFDVYVMFDDNKIYFNNEEKSIKRKLIQSKGFSKILLPENYLNQTIQIIIPFELNIIDEVRIMKVKDMMKKYSYVKLPKKFIGKSCFIYNLEDKKRLQ